MEDTIAARFDGLHVGPVIMMSFRLARLPRDYTYKWVFYHSMKQSEHESMVRCMSLSNSSSALSLSLLRYLLLEYVCCCRSTATGKRPHENFSSGSYEGVREEEQSLAVRFSSSRGSVGV